MNYYLAPLEGITGYIYRRAYHEHFTPMDKYFTPFLVPHTKKGFSEKETADILPEHSRGMYLVPQIMSNDAEMFLKTVDKLRVYGYEEVNLNLGCPSKTVVSKFRGSGFLAKPDALKQFLDTVFEHVRVRVSIKTRIGKESPEEFERLLEIYREYPLEELIIHPRIQTDMYKYEPRLEYFQMAVEEGKQTLCYNGDIYTPEDAQCIEKTFPSVERMMLGRGIIKNPALLYEIKMQESGMEIDRNKIRSSVRDFLAQIREDYIAIGMGEKHTLFKMKELWCYMGGECPGAEALLGEIRKSQTIAEYEVLEREILSFFGMHHETHHERIRRES